MGGKKVRIGGRMREEDGLVRVREEEQEDRKNKVSVVRVKRVKNEDKRVKKDWMRERERERERVSGGTNCITWLSSIILIQLMWKSYL